LYMVGTTCHFRPSDLVPLFHRSIMPFHFYSIHDTRRYKECLYIYIYIVFLFVFQTFHFSMRPKDEPRIFCSFLYFPFPSPSFPVSSLSFSLVVVTVVAAAKASVNLCSKSGRSNNNFLICAWTLKYPRFFQLV